MRVKRIKILNIPVNEINIESALEWIDSAVASPGNKRIVAVNPEKVMEARKDPKLLNFLEESDLLIPDGIGVVMAARLLGLASMERVAGSDLMPAICDQAAKKGYSVFIYGSKPEVNEKSVAILKSRYPGLIVAGASHGYVMEDEMDHLVHRINNSGAQILFVALGSPGQEKWIEQYGPKLSVRVSQGIGGTLDTIAGNVRRAPRSFQRLNLEWFYRLIDDPRRVRRQVVLPLFLMLVILEKLKGSRTQHRGNID